MRYALLTALATCLTLAAPAAAHKPTYRTPGYPGLSAVPKFSAGSSSKPGKPVKLGGGYRPHLLVDGAGTGHIVFSTSGHAFGPPGAEQTTAGADHYCRLPRGATRCAASATFVVPEVYAGGPGDTSPYFDNQPGFNTDIGEGARPLASGGSLLLLMHRSRNVIQVPGGYSDDANFLYSSDDGGKSFTGPGIVGTLDYESGAVVYGSGIQSIGVLGTTPTTLSNDPGHDYFQGTPAGAFAPASAIGQLDPTYGSGDGRSLALDGTRPVAAFNTVSRVTVREYRGSGDINSPSSWTESSLRGSAATLAGGPHGAWLAYQPIGIAPREVVVRLVHGRPAGRPVAVYPRLLTSQDNELTADANGGLTAAWVARDPQHTDSYDRLTISQSTDGRHWSRPKIIARGPHHQTLSGLQIATAPDGGGFAMYVHGKVNDGNPLGAFSLGGQVVAVPFGPRGPTGQKGLGGLGGGAGGTSGCLDVRFGDVHAHVDAGCFLRDPADPTGSAAIAYGGVHVNGLELRPDAPGTAIVINPRTHTIDGVHGTVSILLQAAGVPDIKLWDGSLHAFLGARDHAGDLLFGLPMTGFHANVLGFQALGIVDVVLGKESVQIPMALRLPQYMHATAQATLIADSANDLERSSLRVSVPDLELGGLEVSHTVLVYAGPAEQWTGTAGLNVPPGSGTAGMDVRGARVSFDHGDFDTGGFESDPFPGTAVYRNVFLNNFDAAFDLHPKARISGNAELGAIPQGANGYALQATGPFAIAFGSPSVMSVDGDGAIEGVPLSAARASFSTDGQFSETGSIGLDTAGLTLAGRIDATAALAAGSIAGTVSGTFAVEGQTLASKTIPFNSDGFGVCEDSGVGPFKVSAGFLYTWSGGAEVHLLDCDTAASASATRARAASLGFSVVAGSNVEALTVHGGAGSPRITLTSPSGQTVIPSSTDAKAPAIELGFPHGALTAVAIRHPAAGVWHLAPAPGSAPITSVVAARGYPPPALRARVVGVGHRRVLVYRVALHPGLIVRFAEVRRGRVLAVLGRARSGPGRIGFAPAAGPAGSRQIVALLSGAGTVPGSAVLARYRAPANLRPGHAGIRLSRRGRAFVIRVDRADGAARYLVSAVTQGGRRVRIMLGTHRPQLRVAAAGWSDRIVVTVTPLSASGRSGRTTRARLSVSFTAPHYAGRRAKRHSRPRRH